MRVNPWADAGVACVAQWTRVADAVDALPDDRFDVPSGLPGWRVAELVAHLAMCASSPARWLTEPTPDRAEATVAEYLLCLTAAASSIDERTHSLAAGQSPAQLRANVRAAVDSLRDVMLSTDPALVIPTRLAPMRFDDFLVTRCVEGVVHGLDLSPAVEPDAGALRIATRALLAALVAKAPGHTVEVRVPPIAAVQCVEGPRHTRGTPPNVVELDPLTWVRLAAGRLLWTEAVADGRVRASGERSNISALLPIL
ncbi:MAG TPA: sterol carrier family protein [Acidothermaceae bacterium]